MKRIEKILGLIFILAIILRIAQIPFSEMLLIISATSIGVMYFAFSFYFFKSKKIKEQNVVFSILSGVIFSLSIAGVVFKMQSWPLADTIIKLSVIGIILVFILAIVFNARHKSLKKYNQFIVLRSTILGTLVLIVLLMPKFFVDHSKLLNEGSPAKIEMVDFDGNFTGIKISGELIVDTIDTNYPVIEVWKSGTQELSEEYRDTKEYILELDFNNEYILKFKRGDYLIKTLVVNTSIPDTVSRDFPLIELNVDMREAQKAFGMQQGEITKLVYNPTVDDFCIDRLKIDLRPK